MAVDPGKPDELAQEVSDLAEPRDASCHVFLALRRGLREISPDSVEAAYIAGLEALACNDLEAAIALLHAVVERDPSCTYTTARLLLRLLDRPVDAPGLAGGGARELLERAPDEVARKMIVASILSVRPRPGAPFAVLSGFHAHPELALALARAGSLLGFGEWSPGISALEETAELVTGTDAEQTPSLAFVLDADPSGRFGISDATQLATLLLADALVGDSNDSELNASSTPWPALSSLEVAEAFVASLVSTRTSDAIKLCVIDPKHSELADYDGLPHLLFPVTPDVREAIMQLQALVLNMNGRYELLQKLGARDIKEANRIMVGRGWEPLPHFVCVVGGLAELIQLSRKEVETSLEQLAEKGRAVGVHVVLTVRAPSDLAALPTSRTDGIPVALRGLRAIRCWTYLSAGQPDRVLALLADTERSPGRDQFQTADLARMGALRLPLTAARRRVADPSFLYKASALAMKGLTDAALVVYDDAIRHGIQEDDPGRHAVRYAKADLLVKTGDLGGARRELARLYADVPGWNDRLGLLDNVKSSNGRPSREPIPEHVRHAVWRRDRGRCTQCGSQEKLEFDHIIPLSRGGANTERNLQLLCEPCNRHKSATI